MSLYKEKILKKVYIVSGLDKKDGNSTLNNWRFQNAGHDIRKYIREMDWDEDLIYEVDLTGKNIEFSKCSTDCYWTTSSELKLKDLKVTCYRITSEHKTLDDIVDVPWKTVRKQKTTRKKKDIEAEDDPVVCYTADGPRTKSQEEARRKNLRDGTIEAMKKAVKDEPDKYDANRLNDAINALNKVSDDNLDAYLILGKHLSILMKQIEFSKDEIKKLYDMLKKNFEIKSDQRCKQDDRTRDDFQFLIKTKNCDKVVVWVNKMEPLFSDYNNGYYNILMCGNIFSLVEKNFGKFEDMLDDLKSRIEKCKC